MPELAAQKVTLPVDWERGKVDEARRLLDDIPPCREADYAVRWIDDPLTNARTKVPVLVLRFPIDATGLIPALAIRLLTDKDKWLEGDLFRRRVREMTEHYLVKNCLWIPTPDGANEIAIRVRA